MLFCCWFCDSLTVITLNLHFFLGAVVALSSCANAVSCLKDYVIVPVFHLFMAFEASSLIRAQFTASNLKECDESLVAFWKTFERPVSVAGHLSFRIAPLPGLVAWNYWIPSVSRFDVVFCVWCNESSP